MTLLLLVIALHQPAAAQAERPQLARVVDADGSTTVGQLLCEDGDTIELLDLARGGLRSVAREQEAGVHRDPSDEELTADKRASRVRRAQEFHQRARQPSGVLVPMYVYPANIHTNPEYNRLIDLKRRHETVPVWVILNPASGPGEAVDANYVKAIDRLQGAGCVTLGYVTTSYAARPAEEVEHDIHRWHALYPRIQGIFFDETGYEDSDRAVQYQVGLNRFARDAGFWPTVANPGADTPGRYFASDAADVIVIHEGSDWPAEDRLQGDYFGGYSDYPPFTRGVLVHSMPTLDPDQLRMMRKYARWFYVTEAPFRPDDPAAANPWDRLSRHLERLFELLADQ